MSNKIKREHHFESNGQAYTALIVRCAKEHPWTIGERPGDAIPFLRPEVLIRNDNVKDDCYDVQCFPGTACIDGEFDVYPNEVDEIWHDEQCNVLHFRLDEEEYEKACKDAYGDDFGYDDAVLEYEIPCDGTLAAFILKMCELDYIAGGEFLNIEDFTIEV